MRVDVARRGGEGRVVFERLCGGSVLRPVRAICDTDRGKDEPLDAVLDDHLLSLALN